MVELVGYMSHILDDSCTYVRYCRAQPEYRLESELAFGQFNGCFEKPSMTQDPKDDIDCPDIAPLTFSNNTVNRDAMRNPSKLVHPDSSSLVKYCMGTGLQMRKGRTSHKLKSCEYHNVNKSRQGKFVRTMTQEAMQVLLESINISYMI